MAAVELPIRSRWATTAAAVALVLLATAGAALGFTVTGVVAGPKPDPAVAALPVLTRADTDVFSRPQRPSDLRGAAVGGGFLRPTLRRIAVTPDVPTIISAARTASGDVCLVAAVRSGIQYVSSCVPPKVFALHGVTLHWSLSGWSAAAPFVEQGYLIRFFTLVWGPDDRLRYHQIVQGTRR
jgi:hypothetical protein